jgi:hypothetical protein
MNLLRLRLSIFMILHASQFRMLYTLYFTSRQFYLPSLRSDAGDAR